MGGGVEKLKFVKMDVGWGPYFFSSPAACLAVFGFVFASSFRRGGPI